jgi:hypothetical protein
MPGEVELQRRARTEAINQDASIALLKAQRAVERLNRSVASVIDNDVMYSLLGERKHENPR